MTAPSKERPIMPHVPELSRRRLFVTGAALTTVVAGAGSATRVHARDASALAARDGEEVILAGRLAPAAKGQGHFLTLSGRPDEPDVRVYPRDARFVGPGRAVTVKGRLQVGKFSEISTAEVVSAVLLDAVMI